ncbi:MAG: exodeoxyribonuclease VII large subunit [Deltaproteobacteria bacterium]|nr:exodeoxyribonuclease VII large subunit [Deltaproteobacteria bacterium]
MKDILTVTKLNLNIKTILEANFSFIWVEGEISNLRRPQSGHAYFTLKDENSQIRAVIFRLPFGMRGSPVAFDVEEGMSIICRARLSVYQPRGEYQLIIDAVEPKGIGALQKAFEQLKERLQKEGLFDERHKKQIPFLPQRIGVITSPTGAVIRDILSITGRRFPSVDILIAPVRVQGSEAPAEIIRALERMNRMENIDVVILARGGGSLEDLMPFNDEGVARKIYASRIPVISAVGHETDFTIADFAADLRTPTPSAAAEMVVPIRTELLSQVESFRLRLIQYQKRVMEKHLEKMLMLEERLRDPVEKIHTLRLFLDDGFERLKRIIVRNQSDLKSQIARMGLQVNHANPVFRLQTDRAKLLNNRKALAGALLHSIGALKNRVVVSMSVLDTLSPMAILRRGYSIAKRLPDGAVVTAADDVQVGGDVHVKVLSGSFAARVTNIYKE